MDNMVLQIDYQSKLEYIMMSDLRDAQEVLNTLGQSGMYELYQTGDYKNLNRDGLVALYFVILNNIKLHKKGLEDITSLRNNFNHEALSIRLTPEYNFLQLGDAKFEEFLSDLIKAHIRELRGIRPSVRDVESEAFKGSYRDREFSELQYQNELHINPNAYKQQHESTVDGVFIALFAIYRAYDGYSRVRYQTNNTGNIYVNGMKVLMERFVREITNVGGLTKTNQEIAEEVFNSVKEGILNRDWRYYYEPLTKENWYISNTFREFNSEDKKIINKTFNEYREEYHNV